MDARWTYVDEVPALLVEIVQEGKRVSLGDGAHHRTPSGLDQQRSRHGLQRRDEERRAYHASPNDIPPIHSGDTFTEALGASRRCLPRRVLGSGAACILGGGQLNVLC